MKNKLSKQKFGIWGNTDKDTFWSLLDPIIEWSKDNSLDAQITTRIKDFLPDDFSHDLNVIQSADDFDNLDFLIALGVMAPYFLLQELWAKEIHLYLGSI